MCLRILKSGLGAVFELLNASIKDIITEKTVQINRKADIYYLMKENLVAGKHEIRLLQQSPSYGGEGGVWF